MCGGADSTAFDALREELLYTKIIPSPPLPPGPGDRGRQLSLTRHRFLDDTRNRVTTHDGRDQSASPLAMIHGEFVVVTSFILGDHVCVRACFFS